MFKNINGLPMKKALFILLIISTFSCSNKFLGGKGGKGANGAIDGKKGTNGKSGKHGGIIVPSKK